MAKDASPVPGLAFPRETFAKLTPAPFLHAHLKQAKPVRPSGRAVGDFREPTINIGSLSHSNGSAVVRLGDTAVVCGVRAEILLASDIPSPPKEDLSESQMLENLGLIVPNVELSTGCSPNHLPGNAPGTQAQALSYRLSSLLYSSEMLRPQDLRIEYTTPQTDDDLPDQGPQVVTKAYWTLYIDILCIALDGNAYDAAWIAVIAALQDCKLPKAWWDQDREMVLCSPLASEASKLHLRDVPIPATFAIFSTLSPLKQRSEADHWVMADPDEFEAALCAEMVTMVVRTGAGINDSIVRIEKHGGGMVGRTAMKECFGMALARAKNIRRVLQID
ncbi:hypothetical protein LTR62_001735 [Meristemomyces frigidus]|uniref:Ribosomal RNA-processing protein 43 n=1 Tax=Meristemomyces frigidus TaxID=1508187 RepID=A0AAN7YHU9_9PEZI|nr:hypothetical protein LTR62_001735 [Meristemomyces frigidus]